MENRPALACPNCQNTLVPKTFNSVELDVCQHGCHGIWFDYYELQALEKSGSLAEIDKAFEGTHTKRSLAESLEKGPQHHCPKDERPLDRYEWNPGSGIVFESCPRCRGIWLDAGELEAYVRYVQTFRTAPPKIPDEIRLQMEVIEQQGERHLDEAAKTVVRWNLGYLDDVLRTLIKGLTRIFD